MNSIAQIINLKDRYLSFDVSAWIRMHFNSFEWQRYEKERENLLFRSHCHLRHCTSRIAPRARAHRSLYDIMKGRPACLEHVDKTAWKNNRLVPNTMDQSDEHYECVLYACKNAGKNAGHVRRKYRHRTDFGARRQDAAFLWHEELSLRPGCGFTVSALPTWKSSSASWLADYERCHSSRDCSLEASLNILNTSLNKGSKRGIIHIGSQQPQNSLWVKQWKDSKTRSSSRHPDTGPL